MTFELKKIDLFSAIKISFLINALVGLIIGLLFGSIMGFFMGIAGQMMPYDQMGWEGPGLGAFGLFGGLLLGLLYAIFIAVGNGVILTGIVILLYNLFAGWLGGIKLNLNEVPNDPIKSEATLAKSSTAGGDTESA